MAKRADEAVDRLAVVADVFGACIGQAQALLRQVQAQHGFHSDRYTAALAFETERLDLPGELCPRRQGCEFGEDAVAQAMRFWALYSSSEKVDCTDGVG